MEEFLVIFVNYDGKELYKTTVKKGESVSYKGPKPTKPEETFIGWNKDLKNINENVIVTAVFEKAKTSNLRLGAISFQKDEKNINILDKASITNEDLYINKETDIER